MSDKPTKFKDLKPAELYRSAIEDFALPIDEADKDSKQVLLAAFAEGGVEWADYVKQHPEVAPESAPVVESEPARGGAITLGHQSDNLTVDDEPARVIVQETPVYNPKDKLLIKMIRENPLFEVRGYRFTSAHPYNLVNPVDADYILRHEDGFRQALPSELEEFYDG